MSDVIGAKRQGRLAVFLGFQNATMIESDVSNLDALYAQGTRCIQRPERFRHVAHGLAKRGYRSGDIEKILGGNWARYFGEILGG